MHIRRKWSRAKSASLPHSLSQNEGLRPREAIINTPQTQGRNAARGAPLVLTRLSACGATRDRSYRGPGLPPTVRVGPGLARMSPQGPQASGSCHKASGGRASWNRQECTHRWLFPQVPRGQLKYRFLSRLCGSSDLADRALEGWGGAARHPGPGRGRQGEAPRPLHVTSIHKYTHTAQNKTRRSRAPGTHTPVPELHVNAPHSRNCLMSAFFAQSYYGSQGSLTAPRAALCGFSTTHGSVLLLTAF